jgi:hypothetical protein
MSRRIALVAAPRARRGGVLRARDEFDPSPLFRRARDYLGTTVSARDWSGIS